MDYQYIHSRSCYMYIVLDVVKFNGLSQSNNLAGSA